MSMSSTNVATAKYILLIMSCKKYAHKVALQKASWLQNFTDVMYYHVVGCTKDELQQQQQLGTADYVFDDINNRLLVHVADDYLSLPQKVIQAYAAVAERYNKTLKYIFKTDDDQNLLKPAFFREMMKLLDTHPQEPAYGGFPINIYKNHFSMYNALHPEVPKRVPLLPTVYCSGRFYFLSVEAIRFLVQQKEAFGKEYFEDYAVGYYLNKYEKKMPLLPIQTSKIFVDLVLQASSK